MIKSNPQEMKTKVLVKGTDFSITMLNNVNDNHGLI